MPEDKEGKDFNKERREELEAAFAVVNEYSRMNEGQPDAPAPTGSEDTAPASVSAPPPPNEPPKPPSLFAEIIGRGAEKPSPQKMTKEERLEEKALLSGVKEPPLYWRIITTLLIIFPPILAIVTLLDIFKVRNRDLPVRYKYAVHYCRLLLITGIGFNFLVFTDSMDSFGSGLLWSSLLSLLALFFPPILISIVIMDMVRRRDLRVGPSYALHYALLFSGLSWLFIKLVIIPDFDTPDILEIVNLLPAIYAEIFPPVLFAMVIIGLFGMRKRHLASRYSHTAHYCRLLLLAGVLWWMLVSTGEEFNFWATKDSPQYTESPYPLTLNVLPSPASELELSAREIARDYIPLVAELRQQYEYKFAPGGGKHSGSAVVIMAGQDDIYLLSCLHVVQKEEGEDARDNNISISMENGEWAFANVIACNRPYDLAILWTTRKHREDGREVDEFFMQFRDFDSLEIGERIYAIGHPLGNRFSLSDGLISQIRSKKGESELIQISAPISPGNSGGPIFDSRGRLMAIASKAFSPVFRAQNINFGVRADAVFKPDRWAATAQGKKALEKIAQYNRKGEMEKGGRNDGE